MIARAAGRARRGFIAGPAVIVKQVTREVPVPDAQTVVELESAMDRIAALVSENQRLRQSAATAEARAFLMGSAA